MYSSNEIKKHLNGHNLTEAAKKSNLSYQTVWNLVNLPAGDFKESTLQALSDYIDIYDKIEKATAKIEKGAKK